MSYDNRNFRCIDPGGGQTAPCRTYKYYTTDNLCSWPIANAQFKYFENVIKDYPNIATGDTIIAVNDSTQVVSFFQVIYVTSSWASIARMV